MAFYRRNADSQVRELERRWRDSPDEHRIPLMRALARAGKCSPELYGFLDGLLQERVSAPQDFVDGMLQNLSFQMAYREQIEFASNISPEEEQRRYEEQRQKLAMDVELENTRIQAIQQLLPENEHRFLQLSVRLLTLLYEEIPAEKADLTLNQAGVTNIRWRKRLWDRLPIAFAAITELPNLQSGRGIDPGVQQHYTDNLGEILFPLVDVLSDISNEETYIIDRVEGEQGEIPVGAEVRYLRRRRGHSRLVRATPELLCLQKAMSNIANLTLHLLLAKRGSQTYGDMADEETVPRLFGPGDGEPIELVPVEGFDELDEEFASLLRFSQLAEIQNQPNAETSPGFWAVVFSNVLAGFFLTLKLLRRCDTEFLQKVVQARRDLTATEALAYQRENEIQEQVEQDFQPYLQCLELKQQLFRQAQDIIANIDAELATKPKVLPQSMQALQTIGWPSTRREPINPNNFFGVEQRCHRLYLDESRRRMAEDVIHQDLVRDIREAEKFLEQARHRDFSEATMRHWIVDHIINIIAEES